MSSAGVKGDTGDFLSAVSAFRFLVQLLDKPTVTQACRGTLHTSNYPGTAWRDKNNPSIQCKQNPFRLKIHISVKPLFPCGQADAGSLTIRDCTLQGSGIGVGALQGWCCMHQGVCLDNLSRTEEILKQAAFAKFRCCISPAHCPSIEEITTNNAHLVH